MGLRGVGAKKPKKQQGSQATASNPAPWKTKRSRVARVIAFVEHLPVTKGIYAGRKMQLLPGQRRFIERVYGDLSEDGRRRIKVAIKSEPRGNGKTGLLAGLCLCHLLGPECEARGEIYSAAYNKLQAALIFSEMKAIIEAVPEFDACCNIQRYGKVIEVMEGDGAGSVYESLSADDKRAHGLSPSLWVFDEFAQAPSADLPSQKEEPLAANTETPSSASISRDIRHAAPQPTPIENNRTIELDRFIPRSQVDVRYLDTPYYVVPRDEVGQEAFAVIRDAMRGKDVVGMGRVVLARRERPIILEPMGDGIRATTLRYSHEIRHAADYFSDIPKLKLPDEMLRIAEHIVETKTSDFDPTLLEDRYRTVLIETLKKKQADVPRKLVVANPSAENVINLMDVLKRSLAAELPARRAASKPPTYRRAAALKVPPPKRTKGGLRK